MSRKSDICKASINAIKWIPVHVPIHIYQYLRHLVIGCGYGYNDLVDAGYGSYLIKIK